MLSRSLTHTAPVYRRILIFLLCLPLVFSTTSCAKRSRVTQPTTTSSATSKRININTASAKELEALPGIGEGLARRIIEHRRRYGPFQRVEHLMMVRGISDARFHAVRHLITVE